MTSTLKLPADLAPEHVTAIIDTREQLPLDLSPLAVESGTLATGDYSVKGLENIVAIERKSLPDLLGCVGQERERFERELKRMLAYPMRAVVVECLWSDLENGCWRSNLKPAAVTGSVLAWMSAGIPFLFAESHSKAGPLVARMLFLAARRRWREARTLASAVLASSGMEVPE